MANEHMRNTMMCIPEPEQNVMKESGRPTFRSLFLMGHLARLTSF